jgi:2-methylcitrate dehydratase PrpD
LDLATDVTGALARFAAGLKYEAIPDRVREYCKTMLLDSLACAFAGYQGEETSQLAGLAADLAQGRESSVIGGDRLSLAGATMVNGYLITAVTMCDVYRTALTHVTPEVIPPALAIAERDGLGGRELLVAIAAGLETTTRIGLGLDYPEFRKRGWHGPGVIGPFGGAAAVGNLLKFDDETMARAFGLAGSQSAGTFAAWGTATIKFHQSRGALSGLMAALLARRSFAATREFLTAKDGGLYNTYTNGGHPAAVTADLGSRWELEQIALRLWPCGSAIQGLVTAMFDLIEKHNVAAGDIESLRIFLSDTAFELHGNFPRYKSKFDALLSAHYAASAILHDRKLSLAQYEQTRYADPKLRGFAAEQVEVSVDPALRGLQLYVIAKRVDGTSLTVRCDHARGTPENPLTRAQVEDKFRTYASAMLAERERETVIRTVTQLEELESVATLMKLLSVGPEATQLASPAAAA